MIFFFLFKDYTADDTLYEFSYNNDYLEFCDMYMTNYHKAIHYKKYLMRESITVPIWANTFSSPLSFLKYFEKQVSQYVDIFSNLKTGGRLFIVGDGPGTASLAAILAGRSYFSTEPNDIGKLARSLGIISGVNGIVEENDIVCLFQVLKYGGLEYLDCDRLIIVDDYLEIEDLRLAPLESGGGKVFLKNVVVDGLVTFPYENPRFMFDKNGKIETLNPVDVKGKAICAISHLPVGQDGRKVAADSSLPYMNLITRNDPNDKRIRGKKSKNIKGSSYEVVKGSNRVVTKDSILLRDFEGFSSMRRVREYKIIGEYYIIRNLRPEKIEGVYLHDGSYVRIYLLYVLDVLGKSHGVYVRYDKVLASEYRDAVDQTVLMPLDIPDTGQKGDLDYDDF